MASLHNILPQQPLGHDGQQLPALLHAELTQRTMHGCRWRDVPLEYGLATTVYNRYNRWSQRGVWPRLFKPLAAMGEVSSELMLARRTQLEALRRAWSCPCR